jgi:hypothetical protein
MGHQGDRHVSRAPVAAGARVDAIERDQIAKTEIAEGAVYRLGGRDLQSTDPGIRT